MIWSLRQRIIGTTLMLVAAAWGADYLTGRVNPQSVKAATPATAKGTAENDDSTSQTIGHILASLHGTNQQQSALRLTRDLFSDDQVRRAMASADAALPPQRDKDTRRLSDPSGKTKPGEPEPVLQLSGIVRGRTPMAIIDGQIVTAGATIGGFRVVRVEPDRVVLIKDDQRRTLILPRPAAVRGRSADTQP